MSPAVPPPAVPGFAPSERAAVVEERLEIVRRRLAEAGAPAVLLDRRADVAWLTAGGELHVVQGDSAVAAPIVVTADHAIAVTPDNEAERVAAEELDGLPVRVEVVPWFEADPVAAVVEASLPVLVSESSMLRGGAVQRLLAPDRQRLAPFEHDRLRWLGEASRAALDAAVSEIPDGATESDVVALLVAPLAAASIRAPVVLAGADDRLRFRHPLPALAPVRDRLMLILVAERWGLHVAGTRMAWRSGDPGAVHPADAVATRVLDAMTLATRPGATLGGILDAAARAYAAEGLPDEWRSHHQGGTIGYAPRERIAVPGDPTVLEDGMAVAWNPSIPGGKAEATLLVREQGAETLLR